MINKPQRLPPTIDVIEERVFDKALPGPILSLRGFTPCMTRQGTVEALACQRSDNSLLAHHLDGRLASTDSLRTAAQVCLDIILSVDEAL